MPARHEFGGFLVASAIPLTAIPQYAGDPGRTPDLLIRFADAAAGPPSAWRHHWLLPDQSATLSLSVEADCFRLRVPGLCDFLLRPRERCVDVWPLRELPDHTLEHLLLDQILPRWLALAGNIVLHAALFDLDGEGVLLVGDSGAGKSTLAALLHASGHVVLSDDAVVLVTGDGGFLARGTYPSIRLNPDAHLGALAPDAEVLGRVADYNDKLRVALAARPSDDRPWPVQAIYQLGSDLAPGSLPEIQALSPRAACIALLRQAFAVDLRDPSQMEPILRFHGALAAAVPVFDLAYPRQFDAAPALLSRLRQHVRALAAETRGSAA